LRPIPKAPTQPMNERGRRARFIPWSAPAPPVQQDRLRKCKSDNRSSPSRTDATRSTTQQPAWPESSTQGDYFHCVDEEPLTDRLRKCKSDNRSSPSRTDATRSTTQQPAWPESSRQGDYVHCVDEEPLTNC